VSVSDFSVIARTLRLHTGNVHQSVPRDQPFQFPRVISIPGSTDRDQCLSRLSATHHKVTVQSLDREMELDDSSVPFQLADDQPGPLDLAELEETRRMVREAIATLPNYLAEILIMRDLQQMSYQELSDNL
jgi:hypothetical protein